MTLRVVSGSGVMYMMMASVNLVVAHHSCKASSVAYCVFMSWSSYKLEAAHDFMRCRADVSVQDVCGHVAHRYRLSRTKLCLSNWICQVDLPLVSNWHHLPFTCNGWFNPAAGVYSHSSCPKLVHMMSHSVCGTSLYFQQREKPSHSIRCIDNYYSFAWFLTFSLCSIISSNIDPASWPSQLHPHPSEIL